MIPADGEVIEGAATVTNPPSGESAPSSAKAAATAAPSPAAPRALRRNQNPHLRRPGQGFLDRMIASSKAPNARRPQRNRAHDSPCRPHRHLLLVCVTLKPFGIYSSAEFSIPVLIALLVCLIPPPSADS